MRKTVLNPSACRRAAGVTLIELMVSMAIGMIIVLALTQITVDFERQKRVTIGSSDSGDSAISAMVLMRSSLASAGHSMNSSAAVGCQLSFYRETDSTAVSFSDADPTSPANLPNPPRLYPVYIAQGASGAADTVTILGGSGRRYAETLIQTSHSGDTSDFVTMGNLGFLPPSAGEPGDVALVTQDALGQPCAIVEVTARSGNNISHLSGSNSRYNNPAGTGQTFAANTSKMTNLGRNPLIQQFSIVNGRFQQFDFLTGTTNVLFDNAISLQAQYGFRNASTGLVNWCDTQGGTGCPSGVGGVEWPDLNAVRLALVLRNANKDCSANSPTTLYVPTGSDPATTSNLPWATVSLAGISDASCYRYQVVESVVPLRNVIWSAQ